MACPLSSSQKNWLVFFAAMGCGLLASFGLLQAAGHTDENVRETLRLTARASFAILLIIFVARPAHQLFTTHFTSRLLSRRRLLGVDFAGMHTAHLVLLFYRLQINEDIALEAGNIPGAIVYLLILAMFVTSFDSTTRMLGRTNWKRLHTIGLYVIFIAFAQREIPRSLETAESANWILTALALAALVLRVLPRWKKRDTPHSTA